MPFKKAYFSFKRTASLLLVIILVFQFSNISSFGDIVDGGISDSQSPAILQESEETNAADNHQANLPPTDVDANDDLPSVDVSTDDDNLSHTDADENGNDPSTDSDENNFEGEIIEESDPENPDLVDEEILNDGLGLLLPINFSLIMPTALQYIDATAYIYDGAGIRKLMDATFQHNTNVNDTVMYDVLSPNFTVIDPSITGDYDMAISYQKSGNSYSLLNRSAKQITMPSDGSRVITRILSTMSQVEFNFIDCADGTVKIGGKVKDPADSSADFSDTTITFKIDGTVRGSVNAGSNGAFVWSMPLDTPSDNIIDLNKTIELSISNPNYYTNTISSANILELLEYGSYEISLERNEYIQGTVYIYENGSPKPLSGADVTVYNTGGTLVNTSGISDAQGKYSILIPYNSRNNEHRFNVNVVMPGNDAIKLLSSALDEYTNRLTVYTTAASGASSDLYTVNTSRIAVTGTVVDKDGNPIAGASIKNNPNLNSTSDSNGRFTGVYVINIPVLNITHSDYYTLEYQMPVITVSDFVNGNKNITITLEKNEYIQGTVYIYENGSPKVASGAALTVYNTAGTPIGASGESDAQGKYRITVPYDLRNNDHRFAINAVMPGNSSIKLLSSDLAEFTDRLTVYTTAVNDLYTVDTSRLIVTGTVLNKGKTAIVGAAIRNNSSLIATSDSNGQFTGVYVTSNPVLEIIHVDYFAATHLIPEATAADFVRGRKTVEITLYNDQLTGRIYVYSNGSPVPISGITVTIRNKAGNVFIGSVVTNSNGEFIQPITTGNVSLDAQYSLTVGTVSSNYSILNEAGTDYGSATNRIVSSSKPVEIYFINKSQIIEFTGTVKELVGDTGSTVERPIPGAQIGSGYYVYADASGAFKYPRGTSFSSVYIYASGYSSKSHTAAMSQVQQVAAFKSGTYDVGSIFLTKSTLGGYFGDTKSNFLSVLPSHVSTSEVAFGTLWFRSTELVSNNTVIISSDSGSTIEIMDGNGMVDVSKIKLYRNDISVPLSPADVTFVNNELRIKMASITANAQYKLSFGVRAPANTNIASFKIDSKILYNSTATANIGDYIVTINNISLFAPSVVKQGANNLRVYGNIITNTAASVRLLISYQGETDVEPIEEFFVYKKSDGYYYVFDNIDLSEWPEGLCNIDVELRYNGNVIAYANQSFEIQADAVELEMIQLSNTAMNNPPIGQYVVANIYTYWASAYSGNEFGYPAGYVYYEARTAYNASVRVNNIANIKSARFIAKTNLMTREYPSITPTSSRTFTQSLYPLHGYGVGTIEFEITTKDNKIITYTMGKVQLIIDPSGYVYDIDTNARIEGATVELLWKDPEGSGEWMRFPAEKFDAAANPQRTDEEGRYGWFVPEGEYMVKVSAPGYYPSDNFESYGPIIVLPEHTEVNIGLRPRPADSSDALPAKGLSLPEKQNYILNFVDEEGNLIVSAEREFKTKYYLTGADLLEFIPEGYELVNTRYGFALYSNEEPIVIKIRKIQSVEPKKEIAADDEQYIEEVETAYEQYGEIISKGAYVSGYSDGTFKPSSEISREEIASMLYKLLGNGKAVDMGVLEKYTDIDANRWSANALAFIVQNGVMGGYGNGMLQPDRMMTRGELAQVIYSLNLQSASNNEGGKVLSGAAGHWAEKAINQLCAAGIMSGYPDGTARPDNPITRAEAIVLISRAFNRTQEFNEEKSFTDVTKSHWAYGYIMNAANGFGMTI